MPEANTDPMVFDDLDPISFEVRIKGQTYVATEASEATAVKFNNARVAAARFTEGELDRVAGAADVEPLLVSECLTKDGKKVTIDFVKSLPSRVVKPIYDRLLDISGLDDKQTVEAINKQIVKLTKKRDKLLKEAGVPNEQASDTTVTSS